MQLNLNKQQIIFLLFSIISIALVTLMFVWRFNWSPVTNLEGTGGRSASETSILVEDQDAAIPPGQQFIPLTIRQPTNTPSPTPTITLTPSPTPTPTAVTLNFCRQLNPPLSIPDFDSVSDTINIGYSGQILDLDIYLNVSHEYVGDLVIQLRRLDDGPQVDLIERPGTAANRCSGQDINVILSDEASLPADEVCNLTPPAISGETRPSMPLNIFDAMNIEGQWRLIISDWATPDNGALNEWCLTAQLR